MVDEALAVILHPVLKLGLAIGRIDGRAFLKAVGEAGGVAQHIDDVQPRRRRTRHEGDIATAADEHAQIGKFGNIFRHRLAECDFSLLDQLHEGDRGDRLGHAGDAENGIMIDARRPGVCHFIAAPDQQRAERQLPAVEIFGLDMCADAGQPIGEEAEFECCAAIAHINAPSAPRVAV